MTVLEAIRKCLLGDNLSRLYLETMVIGDEFWANISPVFIELSKGMLMDKSVLQFFLAMVNRRIKVFSIPYETGISVYDMLLQCVNNSKCSEAIILRSISSTLALIWMKFPADAASQIFRTMTNSYNSNGMFILTFLTELSEISIIADHAHRLCLRGKNV